MKVLQTNTFGRKVKRLHHTEKKKLDTAIKLILKDPFLGEVKKSDLAGIRVYKFKIQYQLMLLGYIFNSKKKTITLLAFASHENFYRDLKR